jgi:hypothetical protein
MRSTERSACSSKYHGLLDNTKSYTALIKDGGESSVFTPDAPGGSGCVAVQVQYLIYIFFQVYLRVFHF